MDVGELDKLYRDAESCDSAIFSEMRSNILLVSGDHYSKSGSKFWDRVKESKGMSEPSKLRLTKNHTATICRKKVGKVLAFAPNTTCTPNNQDEMQDIKSAELNNAVWTFEKKKQKLRSKIRKWAEDFVHLGECWAKVYWDSTKGTLTGYEAKVDDEGNEMVTQTIETVVDEMGVEVENITEEQIPDKEKPVMSGEFVFERIFAFNVLRDPNSQSKEDSPYFIIRKMLEKSEVKAMVSKEIWNKLENDEETYLVFENETASYTTEKNKLMLREFYFKPCQKYPKGYFYICVRGHILDQGELPFGVFPILYAGHTEIPTSARHRSPIKQMRPYQIEINRTASKIAETQITLGDDKLILNNNAKITKGDTLPGLRGVKVRGAQSDDIKIMPGRSGEQYLPYMMNQISEMYQVMDELESEVSEKQMEPYAMLYFSARNKEHYKKYAEEFEDFLVETTEVFLKLAKEYYSEEDLIPMVGKSEAVNIAEFKNTEPNTFRITVENKSEDSDTMMGRQLAINHTLQYVGKDLDKDTLGMAIKNMPFMNGTEMFSDLTINYDMSMNDMLAMERGEVPSIGKYDDHRYLIKKATSRMKKSDFRFLPPQVQQMYEQYVQTHQQMESQNAQEIQRAQQGFIPTTGSMAKADLYVTTATGKVERATFPAAALEWLRGQLVSQGEVLDAYQGLPQGAQAEMGRMIGQGNQPQMPMPQGAPQY